MDIVINRMKHWAHRLYPKLPFDDVTKQITHLGKKMQIQTNVKKIRLGLDIDPYFDNAITEKENKENLNSDDEAPENEEDRIQRYLWILDVFCILGVNLIVNLKLRKACDQYKEIFIF